MAAKSFNGFAADLKKFSKVVDVEIATVRRKISFDLLKAITDRTPVDTGRAAVSWNLSEGTPDTSVAGEGDHGGAGGRATAVNRGLAVLTNNPFAVSYIVNALPYIQALEFGHSKKQAPSGMVRIALAEAEAGILSRFGK